MARAESSPSCFCPAKGKRQLLEDMLSEKHLTRIHKHLQTR